MQKSIADSKQDVLPVAAEGVLVRFGSGRESQQLAPETDCDQGSLPIKPIKVWML